MAEEKPTAKNEKPTVETGPKLRVFGVLNHLAHNYEMVKLAQNYPVKFSYLENNVRKWTRFSPRPDPASFLSQDQFEWVPYYEPGKYDVAILHVDQQHVNPYIGKGWLYKEMNSVITDIPKIVINHGTPLYEMYDEDIIINGGTVQTNDGPQQIMGMKQLIGDNFMIVNSYEAVGRWGWGYPLIHGLDADEWYDLKKEQRVTVMISPGGLDKYYNRQLLTYIKSHVKEQVGLEVQHITVNYKCHDWEDYKQFLAKSLIYINPTFDSPMPRSRSEAMVSGCCVLTSRYHGASDFIEHGVDGFIMPDNPLSYAQATKQLVNFNFAEAVEIGQRGREMAIELFDLKRYHKQLFDILSQVSSGKKPAWDGSKLW